MVRPTRAFGQDRSNNTKGGWAMLKANWVEVPSLSTGRYFEKDTDALAIAAALATTTGTSGWPSLSVSRQPSCGPATKSAKATNPIASKECRLRVEFAKPSMSV